MKVNDRVRIVNFGESDAVGATPAESDALNGTTGTIIGVNYQYFLVEFDSPVSFVYNGLDCTHTSGDFVISELEKI